MPTERFVMGLFPDENRAVSAVEALADTAWRMENFYSPIPSEKVWDVLGLGESTVGFFTLAGGIIGFVSGFTLAIFTATRWELMVGGKPVVAWVPFFIVGFEATILGSVLGNVLGLLKKTRLPQFVKDKHYDPKCSGRHYGVLAACPDGDQEGLKAFFEEKGGEVRDFTGDEVEVKEGNPR